MDFSLKEENPKYLEREKMMDCKETRIRTKITLIQFLLSVGIVYQHMVWNVSSNAILNSGQSFVFYLVQTCVPFFFMISGYLFFRTYEPTKAKEKLLSRIRTLLIPYLIWNAIYAVFIVGLTKIGFIHNAVISENFGGVIFQVINAEFSPLWFVKYLMIFTLSAPLMYYILRKKILGFIAIIGMLIANALFYYIGSMKVPLDVNANNLIMLNYQYIFYAVGAYGALNKRDFVENPSMRKSRISGGILLILLCFVFWLVKYDNVIINHCFRLIYVIVVWFTFDFAPSFKTKKWMGNSFFLYCSHLIVLQCVYRVCDIVLRKLAVSNWLFVFEYIFLPIIVIVFLIMIAEFMKKRLPKVYALFTGGRG